MGQEKGDTLMSEKKVALSSLVGQAWQQLQGVVLEEVGKKVEELAEAERESRLGRGRHVRGESPLRRWGYKVRKSLMTAWGTIQGLRLPRIRDVEKQQEVSFLSSERAESRLVEMLLACTLGGMAYRKVVRWAGNHLGLVLSAVWVGRVVEAAAERMERRRQQRFSARQFEALVVDAVWVHYRRNPCRRARSGCLLVAIGVEFGGGFRVLDWQVAEAEDREAYTALLGRLYERGLEEVPLIVADGCGSVRAAAEVVYPKAQLQPCLRHWLHNLESLLRKRSWLHKRRLRRDFWWIYEAESVQQGERWAWHFVRRWARSEPQLVHQFWEGFQASITFLKVGRQTWSYRLKTTNLAEGFFRNLRRFLGRFPGFVSPQHSERALGLYLLGAEHA
jgi:putative transposase